MMLTPFQFHAPTTIPEAVDLWRNLPQAKILAGGTFLINHLKLLRQKSLPGPQHIVGLRKISELAGMEVNTQGLRIKAMTRISDLEAFPLPPGAWSVLHDLCQSFGTTPIRNMVTVGGNLASRYPWAEIGTVLLALDAQLGFQSQAGSDDLQSIDQFLRGGAKTDRLLTHVLIPDQKDFRAAYFRVRKSSDLDIPALTVCIRTQCRQGHFSNTRAVINHGKDFARRDTELEKYLDQAKAHPRFADEAIQHLNTAIFKEIDDHYLQHMLTVAVRRTIQTLLKVSS